MLSRRSIAVPILFPADPPTIRAEVALLTADPVLLPATQQGRRLLLRVTAPPTGRGLPVVVLSHGNHLSRAAYRPLVDAWARAGFVVVQPDHEDAPGEVSAAPAGVWRTRVSDVERVIDALPWIMAQLPGLAGRADPRRIAVAGHSLGGFTAELLGGARRRNATGAEQADFSDPRIRAVLLLAPPGRSEDLTPEWRARAPYLDIDFAAMRGPVLVIAGAADRGPMSARDESWRQDAYRLAAPGTSCLVVVAGAGHYLGGINGAAMIPDGDATPERLALVREASIRFLRATLVRPDPGLAAYWTSLGRRPAAASARCK